MNKLNRRQFLRAGIGARAEGGLEAPGSVMPYAGRSARMIFPDAEWT